MKKSTVLFILILAILFSNKLIAQEEFLDIFDSSFMNNFCSGKEVNYDSKFMYEKLRDSSYNGIEISVKQLKEISNDVIINDINQFDNIVFLTIDNSFGYRDTSQFKIPELSKFSNIKYLNLDDYINNCEYELLWGEIFKMPALEYLAISSLGKHELKKSEGFLKLLSRLKGLAITGYNTLIPNIKDFDLSLSEIVINQNDSFALENIKLLDFEKIKGISISLDSINPEIVKKIKNLKNIEYLRLGARKVDTTFAYIKELNDLINLKLLDLSRLKTINFEGIYKFQNLEKLNLNIAGSNLDSMSKVFSLPKLKDLKISCYYAKEFIVPININNTLENFIIENGRLESIPIQIGNLKNLRRLDIKWNHIKQLPESIGDLHKLEYLNLYHSDLKILPASISNLHSLIELDLTGNELESLPSNIGNLSNLQNLKIGYNFIKTIPASIENLTNLRLLELGNNELSNLPTRIGNLKELEVLDVRNNKPSRNLKNTKYDGRNNNKINSIPKSIIELEKLKSISFSYNESLGNDNLELLLKSKSMNLKLSVENCGITKLPEKGWDKLNLKELIIGGNNIEEIPRNIYNSKLERIIPFGNKYKWFRHIKKNIDLKIMAFLNGFLSKEELLKQDGVFNAIMDICGRFYYKEERNPILTLYPIAYELDSLKIKEHIDHENYAAALYNTERYVECIPHFTEAIKEDEEACMRVINFIVPNYMKRAKAYTYIGDTSAAIKDYKNIQESYNYNMTAQIGEIYYLNDEMEKANIYFKQAKDYYLGIIEKKENWSYKLNVLEILILLNDFSSFDKYFTKWEKNKPTEINHEVIFEYLKLLRNINEIDQVDIFINHSKEKKYDYNNWDCSMIEKWANTKSSEKQKLIKILNQFISN